MFWLFSYAQKSETAKCWLHYDCILNTYLEVDLMPLLRFDVIEGRSKEELKNCWTLAMKQWLMPLGYLNEIAIKLFISTALKR